MVDEDWKTVFCSFSWDRLGPAWDRLGNASDIQNTIQELCELKDPAVIPYLVPLLNRGSDEESDYGFDDYY